MLLRTLLFVPAHRPRMVDRAATSAADAVVLDLEDAVPPPEKRAARTAAAESIGRVAAAAKPVFVRVNDVHTGETRDDLLAVVRPGLAGVVLPKAESAQDLRDLDVLLREAETQNGVRPGEVGVIPIIESARGLLRCEEIARATDRLVALSAGAEDYTRDLGVERHSDGLAIQHLRGTVVTVAVAYGLAPIDTPYTDHANRAGLLADTRIGKAMGMKGKYLIHPEQAEPVNKLLTPTAAEIQQARRIVAAYEAALRDGVGAVAVDGRMVDAPIAERARAMLAFARPTPPRVSRQR
jgi:citrate lyase subunit beta/citryl-CoA lyase